jgi:pilus assembly protein Flp/PilA
LYRCTPLPELGQTGKDQDSMPAIMKTIWKLRICQDTHGQELVEYALVAGLLACACAAALPDIGTSVVTVFSKVLSVLSPLTDDGSSASFSN